MKLFGTLRFVFVFIMFIGFGIESYADATPVESLSVLECAPKNAKSNVAQAAKTEAGICPDCEALNTTSFNKILLVPEFLDPLNVKVTDADIKNVSSFVSDYFEPNNGAYGNWFDTKNSLEQSQSSLKAWKEYLPFLKACLSEKYNPAAKNGLISVLGHVAAMQNSNWISDEDKESLKVVSSYKPEKAPTQAQLLAICKAHHAATSATVAYYGGMGGGYEKKAYAKGKPKDVSDVKAWYQARIEEGQDEIQTLTSELATYKKEKKPPAKAPSKKNDLPDWAKEAGAEKCGIKPEEIVLLKRYTDDFYRNLNSALRGEFADGITPEQLTSIIRVMNSGLAKIKSHAGTVYRNVNSLPPAVLAKHKVGNAIQFSSYLSTSAEPDGADGFGIKYAYIIQSKTGRNITPISDHKSEREVLFAPMTRFKITKVEKGNGQTIFHMVEL